MALFLVGFVLLGVIALIVGIVLMIVAYATKQKLRPALIVMGVSAVVIVLGSSGIGLAAHQQEVAAQRERVAQAKEEKADNKAFDQSHSELMAASYLAGTAAENLGNKINKAWNSAIFDDGGAVVGGKHYTDFNDAIAAVLSSDTKDAEDISTAEDKLDSALAIMRKRVTPKNKQKLADAEQLASAVKKLDNIVTSPSGNLESFNQHFSDADQAVSNQFQD